MTTAAPNAEARHLTNDELAFVVKLFREQRQWSQEQLAEVARVSPRTVQRVEEGKPSSLDTRRALSNAFGFEDIDALNKPYAIPTAEQMAADKARLEKETITLKGTPLKTGKQLGKLLELASGLLFSEAFELSPNAEQAFATFTDCCTEYADCDELYSATDKLKVYADFDELLETLTQEGASLVGASREVILKVKGSGDAWKSTIVYVVAFPVGQEAEHLAVPREVHFSW